MSGYTSVFSGSQVILPSGRSYSALALVEDTTLLWPTEEAGDGAQLTAILDVTPDTSGWQIMLPPADEASPGSAALFVNVGVDSFEVRVNDGSLSIVTVAAGVAVYVYLSDNGSTNGTWQSFTLGAGSVNPSLASQTGAGLVYFAGLLAQGYPISDISSATYSVTESDRATLLVATGGATTCNLAAITGSFNSQFFFLAKNSGSGTLTLDPASSQTIDGQTSIVLNQNESCFVLLDTTGSTWRTVGRPATSTATSVTSGLINIAGTGSTTLSSAQLAFTLQEFQGTLAGNRLVTYGAQTGVWYVYNNTSGAFTTTFRVDGSDTGVVVDQGSRAIITLNGVNATLAFTFAGGSGSVTSVATGTDLTGGPITGSGTVSHANSGVAAGSYGDATSWPAFTVNARGHVSSASSFPLPTVTGFLPTTGGTGTGTYAFLGPVSVASLTATSASISGLGAFGAVSATNANFSGSAAAATFTGTSASISGTGAFGVVSATSVNASGALTGAAATVTGTGAFGAVTATNVTASGAVTAATMTATSANVSGTGAFGVVTGTSAVFSSTGTAISATAGTGAFGAILLGGTAIAAGASGTPTNVRLPVGGSSIIVKRGTGTTNGVGSLTVTFGTAFPNTFIGANLSLLGAPPNTNTYLYYDSETTSGFQVRSVSDSGVNRSSTPVYWEASGS